MTGNSIWIDDAEQAQWYSNMNALEAAAKDVGMDVSKIKTEHAITFRETGVFPRRKAA